MTILKDKVVAVTGASSGIGRALAIELVARGAHVALSDVNEEGLADTARRVKGTTRVSVHRVDVRDRVAVERYAADVEAQHGGADIIVNNAGIAVRATIEAMSLEAFQSVIDVNFWGVVYGTKAFFPLLRKRPEGHIVNISSINAMVPFAKNGPYKNAARSTRGTRSSPRSLMQELRRRADPRHLRPSRRHPSGRNIARSGGRVLAAPRRRVRSHRDAHIGAVRSQGDPGGRGEEPGERVYVGMDAKLMAAAKHVIPDTHGARVRRRIQ